jgi:hypothetical protein
MKCWYLDLEFLNELIEKYNIDLDFEDTLLTYWYTNIKDLNINIFIYETLEKIKNMFLEDNKENIEDLWFNIYNLDYEIFTNYLDSHLWFNDNEIDNLYQNWRK